MAGVTMPDTSHASIRLLGQSGSSDYGFATQRYTMSAERRALRLDAANDDVQVGADPSPG